jgi:hypothetical protein
MDKIWSFGDSFAEGRCSDADNMDGILDKNYANYFADINNITDVEVNAKGGYSRLDISGRILNKIGKIKKDDYVLILKTDSMRSSILPVKLNIKDSFLPNKIHGRYTRNKNNEIDYIDSVNIMNDFIRTPHMDDNQLHHSVINSDEQKLVREFFLNIFLKHKNNFINYYDSFFESAVYSLKDITSNVCIIDSSLWGGKLDYMAVEYFENSSDLYCKCKHWNYKLHEIVGILIDMAIKNNELYVSSKTCDRLWNLYKSK